MLRCSPTRTVCPPLPDCSLPRRPARGGAAIPARCVQPNRPTEQQKESELPSAIPPGQGVPGPRWCCRSPCRDLSAGRRNPRTPRVSCSPLRVFLFRVRRTRPEEGRDVVAGEDAGPPGDEGHAPQPAVVVLPEDADSFSLLQLQLVGSVSHVGMESHAPGGTGGERHQLPRAGGLGASRSPSLRPSCGADAAGSGRAAAACPKPPQPARAADSWVLPLPRRELTGKKLPATSGQRGYE